MAKERIGMRRIKEVLRLGFGDKYSMNKISRCLNVGRATVQDYFRRFRVARLTWPLAEELTDEHLEQKLFPESERKKTKRGPLNFEYLVEEIKKPDVTLALLWEEYKEQNPNGYQYAQFCNLYRAYRKTLNYSMRQEHKAGEKTFADFGKGDAVTLLDPKSGNRIPVNLFVCVWGASNYTFAKAVEGGESLSNWLNCSADSFEYFGCCSKAIVPDNPRSVISRACRYEPDVNASYAEFAQHYDVTVFPARPGRPKDKAKAEVGVKLAKRWILARLRNRVFYSLGELNEAISELLEIFNDKVMKRFKKSRRQLFETLDRPNAKPLPEKHYEFAQWKKVKVNIDYHIEFDEHYYSVPYTLIKQELEIKITGGLIAVFRRGKRICSHRRSYDSRQKTVTVPEHMPKSHREHLEWTPSRILQWAAKYGQAVKELVEKIMTEHSFPEQGYRACLGIIRLESKYSADKLNRACDRALRYRVHSYSGVRNILLNNLEELEESKTEKVPAIQHENIRGPEYYQSLNSLAPSLN
ncbi:MAG: IS21 family transposase [bacterium]